jgi:5-methylcytosine-specific restriction protein B
MSGDDETEVSYEIEEGIFKSICKKAEKESSISSNSDNFDEEWEKLIDLVKTRLLENKLVKIGSWEYGLSSKDSLKYSSLNTPSKYNFTITKQNVYDAYRNKKARPSGAFQKDMEDVVDFMKSQFNLNNYQENSIINKATSQNFVLIIDEINRGNVSQIFGELITLIEDDKRLGNPEAIQVQLPYSKDWFGVPPNVHIIGTMNTADRSVEALDTALRRRFSFTEMPPKSELIKTEGKTENGIVNDIDLSALLETINKRIEKLLDKDHMIGHSYFLSVKDLKDLKSAFQNKIVPLMQEYFFGDYGKIGLIIGSKFFDIKDNQVDEDFFAPFEDYDSSPLVERKVYHLKNIQDMSDELFVEALNDLQRKIN